MDLPYYLRRGARYLAALSRHSHRVKNIENAMFYTGALNHGQLPIYKIMFSSDKMVCIQRTYCSSHSPKLERQVL